MSSPSTTSAVIAETPTSSADTAAPTVPETKKESKGSFNDALANAVLAADIEAVDTLLKSGQFSEANISKSSPISIAAMCITSYTKLQNDLRRQYEGLTTTIGAPTSPTTVELKKSPTDSRCLEAARTIITTINSDHKVQAQAPLLINALEVVIKLYTLTLASLLEARAYADESEAKQIASKVPSLKPWVEWTPLHRAAASGDLERVKTLIAESANINATDTIGKTALFVAARRGHVDVVNALLEAKADSTITYKHKQPRDEEREITPLMIAAQHGHRTVVQSLFQDVTIVDLTYSGNSKSALDYAICGPELETVPVEICTAIIDDILVALSKDQAPAAHYTHDPKYMSARDIKSMAVSWAARSGLKNVVIKLLDNEADPQYDNWNAVFVAAESTRFPTEQDRIAVLERLLPTFHLPTRNGSRTVLSVCSSPQVLAYFIHKGADLFVKGSWDEDFTTHPDVLREWVEDSIMRDHDSALAQIKVIAAYYLKRVRETGDKDEVTKIQLSLYHALKYALFCNNPCYAKTVRLPHPASSAVVQVLLSAGANIYLKLRLGKTIDHDWYPPMFEDIIQYASFAQIVNVFTHAYTHPSSFKEYYRKDYTEFFLKICFRYNTENIKKNKHSKKDFVTICEWLVTAGADPNKIPGDVMSLKTHRYVNSRYITLLQDLQQTATEQKDVTAAEQKIQKQLNDLVNILKPNATKVVEQAATDANGGSNKKARSNSSDEKVNSTPKAVAGSYSVATKAMSPNSTASDPGDAKAAQGDEKMALDLSPTTCYFENAWQYMIERQTQDKDYERCAERNLFFALFLEALNHKGKLPDSEIDVVHILELGAERTNEPGRRKTFSNHCKALLQLFSPGIKDAPQLPCENRQMQINRLLKEYKAFLSKDDITVTLLYRKLMSCITHYEVRLGIKRKTPLDAYRYLAAQRSAAASSEEPSSFAAAVIVNQPPPISSSKEMRCINT